MAEVRAFRGYRYDLQAGGPASGLIAPPFDIITAEGQRALQARSPYNVVRLELPEGPEDLAEPANRYARAAATFTAWREAGILQRDPEPALYLYGQEFALPGGERKRRLGVLASLGLAPFEAGVVLPHERTFPKHKEDRFRLLTTARAQFSPIMGIYRAEGAGVRSALEAATPGPPDLAAADGEGVRHSLWVCRAPERIRWFQDLLASRQVFIADGHHRYSTALRYQAERRAAGGRSPAWWDGVMTYLVAMEDPGWALMPTHRLVRGLPHGSPAQILAALAPALQAEPRPTDWGDPVPGGALGLLLPGEPPRELRLRGENPVARLEPERPLAWRDLEAVVLQRLVLSELLSAGLELEVVYTRDAAEARRQVASGAFQAAFLLPPPQMEEVRAVALAGEVMPEKTTYFWPKAWAGLVIYGEGAL
jgi:uncharacterized protein (DUF1015 family)